MSIYFFICRNTIYGKQYINNYKFEKIYIYEYIFIGFKMTNIA